MSRLARAVLAALLACAVAAGVAYADGAIYAAPPNQFVGGDITVAQGEAVTFSNADTVAHDVTASAKASDGKPLFQSAQIGPAQTAPVAGVEFLTAGSYPYICSIHPFMTGTITVSPEGTPKPGGGNGGDKEPPAPAADTAGPALKLRVLDTKRSKVRKRRSLQVSLSSDEPATVTLVARAGSTVVATGKANLTKKASRKVSMKLTRAGMATTRKSKAVTVGVEANGKDAAGNAASAHASGKLR